MKSGLTALSLSGALAMTGSALAHHSFAMFDQDRQVELEGVVREFRFTAPHTFIVLDVRAEDGRPIAWALEGGAPTALVRDGWTPSSLQPGDEIKVMIAPLRSGAPGGWWTTKQINFRNGKPIVISP